MKSKFILFIVLLLSFNVEGKEFKFSSKKFSTHIFAIWSFADPGNTAYANSSGGTTFTDSPGYLLGGDIGFGYNFGAVGIRLSLDLLAPQKMRGIDGNLGATSQFDLTSTVIAILPGIHLELNFINKEKVRGYLEGGISYGWVNIFNDYSFTAAGTANYGISNFEEHVKQTAIQYSFGVGFEFLLTDNAIVAFRGQYKLASFDNLVHRRAVTNFQGAVTPGTVATNDNSNNRAYDMTGIYTGLGLRIYY